MKKQIALFALAAVCLGTWQQPAFSAEVWFNNHDHNHDGRWNYNEYRNANQVYFRHHHDENRWSDHEMRHNWDGLNHDGYVTQEQVRTIHHW
jgi:hypothetical protein